jgi:hypothetical protein
VSSMGEKSGRGEPRTAGPTGRTHTLERDVIGLIRFRIPRESEI